MLWLGMIQVHPQSSRAGVLVLSGVLWWNLQEEAE
jgi:hypothetical protein